MKAPVILLTVAFFGSGVSACEGSVIDGGETSAAPASTSSAPPKQDVARSFFGNHRVRALTRTSSPQGTEIDATEANVGILLSLAESGRFAYDDGATCVTGSYTFRSGATDRGSLEFDPAIGGQGSHDLEYLDTQLAIANLVPTYPWARLEVTADSPRCR